ncbi:MAG: nucleotide exchange factor GrpE [Deltaproteobacteria bacterium]|nr:nucleotide exchange factor GrpE [Deltaproteobacteria bacterium]
MTDSPENGSSPDKTSQPGEDPPADGGAPEQAATPEPPPPDPVEQAKAEASKLRDQLLRTAADFDNYRKRSRREVDDSYKKGAEELLRALLPVFDNLERAVVHAEQTTDAKAIAEGVKMVLKQFNDSLERVGIKRVGGVGQPFDPLVHEAIQQVETDEHPAGTVVAEVQPGYAFGERLVRAAMVVVARPKAKMSEPPREPS